MPALKADSGDAVNRCKRPPLTLPRLFDCHRVRRRGDAAFQVHRHRYQHTFVALVGSAVRRQLLEVELLANRQAEQAQGAVVQRALVLEIPRPRLDRGTIRADGGDAIVPKPFDHRAAVFDAAGLEPFERRHRRLGLGRRGQVRLHPARANQQNRARLQFDALCDRGLFQIIEAVFFRLERIDRALMRDAVAKRVEQHGAPDKLVRPFVDAEPPTRPVLYLSRLHAVVERLVARAADVREAVPLAAFLRVVTVERVVETEQAEALEAHDVVLGRPPREQRGFGVIDFRIEPEDGALAHEARRVDDALRRQEIQASELVVVAKHAPRRFFGFVGFDWQLGKFGDVVEIDFRHRISSLAGICSRRPSVEHVGLALHAGGAVGKLYRDEAARLVKTPRGSVALKRPEAKARGAKMLCMRQHRIADAAPLFAGRDVKLIDHVGPEHQHRDNSPIILGDPGLALRHHLVDDERANLIVSANSRQPGRGTAPRRDIHRRNLGRVGSIRAPERDSHQSRSPPESPALSRIRWKPFAALGVLFVILRVLLCFRPDPQERAGMATEQRIGFSLSRRAALGNVIRLIPALVITVAMLVTYSCGSSGLLDPVSDSGSPTATPTSGTGALAFVTNFNDAKVSSFTRNTNTGVLKHTGQVVAGKKSGPRGVVATPNGQFLYVANVNDNNIYEFSINANNGTLTALTPASVSNGNGSGPDELAINPDGTLLWVTNAHNGTVGSYMINTSTGQLTSVGTIGGFSTPFGITLNPALAVLYVSDTATGLIQP